MDEILIECSPGVSGDMLLGAFYDLGVPKNVIEKPLCDLGLENLYCLKFKESNSCSIRAIKVEIEKIDQIKKRTWKSIKELISNNSLNKKLQKIIYKVFESLAIAEGKVHGINPDEVHFHEIGAIDSLIDIIGVCAAINYLNPKKIYCNEPNLGKGFVETEHGKLSIPSPAVIELLSKKNIRVASSFDSFEGELSTPTGIALISNLVDSYEYPNKYSIKSYGVGMGNMQCPFPNLVRILEIKSFDKNSEDKKDNPRFEKIAVQEAWIDDQTPEDIANFIHKLRNEGAYDVSSHAINMKKNRIGYSVEAIVPLDKKEYFRELWLNYSNTIGIRERIQSRWILLRRRGECLTSFGKVKVKQKLKPNGSISMKPENDEILRLMFENNKTSEEIRKIVQDSISNFKAFENWK